MKKEKVYKGLQLVIPAAKDRAEDKTTERDLFLTADSLSASNHYALAVVCAAYMRLNDSLDNLVREYRKQLTGKDSCTVYRSLTEIIREQEEEINDLRRQQRVIINSVISDSCLSCVLRFVKLREV